MELAVATASDMRALGVRLAEVCGAGDLILATGPLGAGKTQLAQGIGAGLGVTGVRSPTYTIADRHESGRVPFIHIDAWRLQSAAELDDLDLELGDAVTFVEWGLDRAEQLAEERLDIVIEPNLDESRLVRLTPVGRGWHDRLADVGCAGLVGCEHGHSVACRDPR